MMRATLTVPKQGAARGAIGARGILMALVVCCAATALSCTLSEPGVDPPRQAVYYPLGLALHPSHQFAVAVNANFNLSYRNGTLSVIDLAGVALGEKGPDRIIGAWTRTIGSFGANAQFNHHGTRLYLTVRGKRAQSGGVAEASGDALYIYRVNVGADPDKGEFLEELAVRTLAPDPYGLAIDAADRFLYVTHLSNGELSVIQTAIGEPVDAALKKNFWSWGSQADEGDVVSRQSFCQPTSWDCADGVSKSGSCASCADGVCSGDGVCMTAATDDVTRYCLYPCAADSDCGAGFICTPWQSDRRVTEVKLDLGGVAVGIHPTTGSVYVGSKYSNRVGVVRQYYKEGRPIQTTTDFFKGAAETDIRDFAFYTPSDALSRYSVLLFAAARNANEYPGISIINASEDLSQYDYRLGRGLEADTTLDFVPTCAGPSALATSEGYLFVSCYSSDRIEVYDIEAGLLMDQILTAVDNSNIRMGPYTLRAWTPPESVAADGSITSINLLMTMFSGHEVQLWRFTPAASSDGSHHSLIMRIHNHAISYN